MNRIDLPQLGSIENPEDELPLMFDEAMQELEDHLNKVQLLSPVFSATPTFDLDDSDAFNLGAMTVNITNITLNNAHTGQIWRVVFLQDGIGSRTIAGWPASVLLTGGSFTPTSTAGKRSSLTFLYDGSKHVEMARSLNM